MSRTSDLARSRRAFVTGLGRSTALLVGAGALVRAAAPSRPPEVARGPEADGGDLGSSPAARPAARHDDLPPAPDARVRAFLGPVAVGTAVGAWSVAAVYGPFRGALPLILAHPDGRRAQVDLLRRDDASPPGVAAAPAGHLYLVNAGRGHAATPPDLEDAIAALARALPGDGAELPLVSHAERRRAFPGGVYVVPA
jgi:hypothetical protein